MSFLGSSSRRILLVAIALTTAGIVIVGMTITLDPPTADIPEPSFNFAHYSLNNLFRYSNNTQGGNSTNMAEFYISFDNIESGTAFFCITSSRTMQSISNSFDFFVNHPHLNIITTE